MMLARRVGLVLLMGHGHAAPMGIASASPLLRVACRSTSQTAARRHVRVTCGPLTHGPLNQDNHLSSCCKGINGNVRSITDGSVTSASNSRVEVSLSELRMKLDRLGSLNLSDMTQAVKSLEQCLEELSDADCLRLLQFCCRMAEKEYRPCDSLIQRVWCLTTDRPNGKVNLEHLELYLHICLTVESTKISKKEIMKILERHRIEPSAPVFEKLMMALGQRGHLGEAMELLAMMKEQHVSVREPTFAALILAYGVNYDWEGVQGVLDTMKSVQMSPAEMTFTALTVVCGGVGQVSRIKQVVFQARQEGVILSVKQFDAMLLALIRNGHAGEHYENIDFILSLAEGSGMKPDLSRLALHLIHCHRVREAVHLLLSLPLLRINNHLYSNAAIYLREIVHARTDPDLVVETCHRLQEEGINCFSLQVALEHALREQQEELAWVLLRTMQKDGLPLREHYFWPLLHLKAINQEPTELLECVRAMLQLGEVPGFITLRDHVIPGMSLSQPCLVLQMLQNTGLPATTAATPLLVVLVKNNMMEHAIKFVRGTKAPFSVGDAISTLAPAWHSKPKSIISLLALLTHRRKEDEPSKNTSDWGGQFLLGLAATRVGLAVHHISPLFQELRKHKIGISEYSADQLMSKLSQPLQEAVRTNLPLVLQAGTGQLPQERNAFLPHPSKMSDEELEGHLVELRAKGLKTRGSLRRLLLSRASKNDTAGVMELLQRASKDGSQLSGGMLSAVLMTYVNSGNVEAALDMLFRLATEYPDFAIDSYKIVDLCTLLTQNGRGPEAMEILQDYTMKTNMNIEPTQIRRNCRNLLMACATSTSSQETEKLFDMLLQGGFVKPDTVSLGPLVKSKLNSGDLRGAYEAAKKIQERYSCLPMRRELLIHLINQYNDSDGHESAALSRQLLEAMVSLIAGVRGSVGAHHDLLFAYLEAGQPSEAGIVLKNLARNLDQSQLTHQLQYYVKTENEAAVVHLLTASRGREVMDRLAVYESLVNIYYVQSKGEKGLSLWTSMQEEGITPSPTFLTTLGALLAACKIKIPFQI